MQFADKYRREVDGLRAVAVIPVVLYHAGFAGFRGGYLGVDVFFVISGYLITRLIYASIGRGEFSIFAFYERRVRRILPALYLVVIVSLAFAWLWLFPIEISDLARSVVAITLFQSNFYFNQEIGYFNGDVGFIPLIHTWSLAVEEQFYAVFPFLLLLSQRLNAKWVLAWVAALSAVSFAWAQWTSHVDPQSDFYLPQFRAWELGAGALVALAAPATQRLGRWPRSGLAGLGATLLTFALVFAPHNLAPSFWSLAPVGGAALLIAFAAPDNVCGRLLGAKPLVGIGLVSYSAYLWHQPLFALARFRFNAPPAGWTMMLLSAAAFVLAYGSWRYVERPIRERRRFSRTIVFVGALTLGAALITSSRVIVIERGFPARLAPIAGKNDFGAYFMPCLDVGDVHPAALARMNACRLGVRDAAPDFILTGDSHATALADGLDDAAKRAGRSGLVFGSSACPPILGLRALLPRSRPYCRQLHDELLEIVDKFAIKLVVLQANWIALDQEVDVDDEAVARVASPEDIKVRLLATLSALVSRGAKVVIFTSTPDAPYRVPEIVARKARYGFAVEERADFAQFMYENRTAFRLFADSRVREYATVIDLYPYFCDGEPNERCRVADGPRPYYVDADHLSRFGSLQLSPILEQAFK